MIYLSTYLKLLSLSDETKELYAEFFGIEVEDLKRISPLRWNREVSKETIDKFNQQQRIKEYRKIEQTSKLFKEGKISDEQLKLFKLTYEEWRYSQRDGIFGVVGYPGEKAKYKHYYRLREAYDKKNLTNKYDKYFDKSGSKIKTELEIYEYNNEIFIFQHIYELDYYDVNHLMVNGLINSTPNSLLFKEGLSLNGKMWGSKEWVIEQVKTHGYQIEDTELYNKKFNSSILTHLPQSGQAPLTCTGFDWKLGPIDFTLGYYETVFEIEEVSYNESDLSDYILAIEFADKLKKNCLAKEQQEKFNYNYDLWLKKGRHDIMDFLIAAAAIGDENAHYSSKFLIDALYTTKYDHCFERPLADNIAPLAVYEREDVEETALLQRIFISDYYNIDHMMKSGLWNNGEMKYLHSEHLALNGVRFAGKEWIEECCEQNKVDTKIFKGKTIEFHILLTFGQSSNQVLISPKAIASMRNIRF